MRCHRATNEDKQFNETKTLISNSYLIYKSDITFKVYSWKSDIAIFAWRVNWKHDYNPFKINVYSPSSRKQNNLTKRRWLIWCIVPLFDNNLYVSCTTCPMVQYFKVYMSPKLKRYRHETQYWKPGFMVRQFCTYHYFCSDIFILFGYFWVF